MHRARGFALTVAATAIVTLGIAVVPLILIARPTEKEEATKVRGIVVKTEELATVPDLPKSRRDQLAKDLEIFLDLVYTQAFVPAAATATPSPFTSVSRINHLLTAGSREALKKDPDVFELGPNLTISSGDLKYRGIVTTHENDPVEAVLEIVLDARAALSDENTEVAGVKQTGTLVLKMAGDGWRLRAFDLELDTKALPSPSPRAAR
jgi:hypothetical protein